MSDERAVRVGLNEALFRQVNEQIAGLNRAFGDFDTMDVVCECGDGDCTARIQVPIRVYETVRADPLRYVIAPGHEIPDVEDVVETEEAYEIVRKHPGAPAEVSRETDPRS